MMKWVKKKRQLLDETAKEEHQINYNCRNNNNNDNVIILPEEIESIKNETPLKKDRTNNEFLSELSKSRFKDIKNENNDQTICSLMKDISSITGSYADALPSTSSNTYKSLLWLLENVYVAPASNATTEERETAAEYRELLLEKI